MKRAALNEETPQTEQAVASLAKQNGKSKASDETVNLNVILSSLQSMKLRTGG